VKEFELEVEEEKILEVLESQQSEPSTPLMFPPRNPVGSRASQNFEVAAGNNQSSRAPQAKLQDKERLSVQSDVSLAVFRKQAESCLWFNRLFHVFWNNWKRTSVFKYAIMNLITIAANRKRNPMLQKVEVVDLTIDGKAPELSNWKKLDSLKDDFLFEFDLSLRGSITVVIKTVINFMWQD